jgi:hypothetical protein
LDFYRCSYFLYFKFITGNQEAQKYTIAVAKAIAVTAIDILQDPKLLAQIKEEYRSGKS